MTYDLFPTPDKRSDSFCKIALPDADILLYESLFAENEAKLFFEDLRQNIVWRREQITVYGRIHDIPRMTAWYGETGKSYVYSGIAVQASPWTAVLLEIKDRVESVSDIVFNSVLLNLYRDGSDSVSWHADDEPELGRSPTIGSLSLGASRAFQMKHKADKSMNKTINLNNGSYLLMKGATQHHWLHQIPKTRRRIGARINLTFRVV